MNIRDENATRHRMEADDMNLHASRAGVEGRDTFAHGLDHWPTFLLDLANACGAVNARLRLELAAGGYWYAAAMHSDGELIATAGHETPQAAARDLVEAIEAWR